VKKEKYLTHITHTTLRAGLLVGLGIFQTQACKNVNVVNCQNCGGYFKQLPECMKEDAEYNKEWVVKG
jgi:hypothetical protein